MSRIFFFLILIIPGFSFLEEAELYAELWRRTFQRIEKRKLRELYSLNSNNSLMDLKKWTQYVFENRRDSRIYRSNGRGLISSIFISHSYDHTGGFTQRFYKPITKKKR